MKGVRKPSPDQIVFVRLPHFWRPGERLVLLREGMVCPGHCELLRLT